MKSMEERDPNFKLNSTLNVDLDFETCVTKEFPECLYSTGSSTHDYGGHQSLISQFCGHDEVSTTGDKSLLTSADL